MEDDIKLLIQTDHEGDCAQISAIFNDCHRIILEAPAGCGKTKTMVSKVAYILSSGIVPVNKKVFTCCEVKAILSLFIRRSPRR